MCGILNKPRRGVVFVRNGLLRENTIGVIKVALPVAILQALGRSVTLTSRAAEPSYASSFG